MYRKVISYAERGEPYSLLGMYDGGQDYVFSLFSQSNFVGRIAPKQRYIRAVSLQVDTGISPIFAALSTQTSSADLRASIVKNPHFDQGITLILLLPHDQLLSTETESQLTDLRSTFPWNFSYCIIGYSSILNFVNIDQQAFYLKNWDSMRLLDEADREIVVSVYENFYKQKVTPKIRSLICNESGGNPGMIKTLFLQAISGNFNNAFDIQESNTYERLRHITETLSTAELLNILEPNQAKLNTNLVNFGYISDTGVPFSRLFGEFLSSSPYVFDRVSFSKLSPQLQLLYALFRNNVGKQISRRTVAQTLWGNESSAKYSDWAIDRAISDLRKALDGKLSIKALKKNGFICSE